MTEPTLAVGAVIVEEGRMLVIRRGIEPGAGQWAVPGGAVDPGETMGAAVRREIREELGVTVEPGGIAWVGEILGEDHHYVIVDFFASIVAGEVVPDGEEAEEARWVPIRDLTNLPLVPSMHDLLQSIWPEL